MRNDNQRRYGSDRSAGDRNQDDGRQWGSGGGGQGGGYRERGQHYDDAPRYEGGYERSDQFMGTLSQGRDFHNGEQYVNREGSHGRGQRTAHDDRYGGGGQGRYGSGQGRYGGGGQNEGRGGRESNYGSHQSNFENWPYEQGGYGGRGGGEREQGYGGYGGGLGGRGFGSSEGGEPDWQGQGTGWQPGRQRHTPKGYKRSDERLREDICEQLSHSGLDVSEVSVSVADGKVTLEGTVRDRRTKHAIEDRADDCMGVQDVDNRIRVERGGSSGQQTPGGMSRQISGGMSGAGGTGSERRGASSASGSGSTRSAGQSAGSSGNSTSSSSGSDKS